MIHELHAWYVALPWNKALAIFLAVITVCSFTAAVLIKRAEANEREKRLAAARDKAAAKLKAHMRKVRIYDSPTGGFYKVGDDAAYRDRNGVWKL